MPGKPYLSLILRCPGHQPRTRTAMGGTASRLPWRPAGDGRVGIHAPLDALPDEDGRFHIELDLQGMNALEVVPLGQGQPVSPERQLAPSQFSQRLSR